MIKFKYFDQYFGILNQIYIEYFVSKNQIFFRPLVMRVRCLRQTYQNYEPLIVEELSKSSCHRINILGLMKNHIALALTLDEFCKRQLHGPPH